MRINPRLHIAQLVLGKHLLEMGRLDEAVAAERTSVEVAPVLQLAHGLLGSGLRRQGRYDEAKAAFAKAAGLRPVPGFNWPYPLDRLSDECDRMKALAPRFERLVSGEENLRATPSAWPSPASLPTAAGMPRPSASGRRRSRRNPPLRRTPRPGSAFRPPRRPCS